TTAQRGKTMFAPEEFFGVSMQEVLSRKPANPFGVVEMLIKIDKRIPNDTGRLEFTVDKTNISFDIGEYNPTTALRPAGQRKTLCGQRQQKRSSCSSIPTKQSQH